ncbi:F-box/LRR-repeat protein [Citrus sinensis]|nr:F-box/LRR-repeat protein [Citrus sinensis]
MNTESHSTERNSTSLEEDRISCLPDEILRHILSFLPTKNAVATCVLSSKWRLVWALLPNLCFDDRLCLMYENTRALTEDASTRFEDFVNRVILCDLGKINKFSLRCSRLINFSRLKSWVSCAVMRNVVEIELNLDNYKHIKEAIELPESIYTSRALEVVKLNLKFFIKNPPPGNFFPSVKTLQVALNNLDKNFPEWLFSNCPVLEYLSIKGYLYVGDLVTLNISSLTLKRLTLELVDCAGSDTELEVVIRAPNLEYLYIKDYLPVSYTVDELHSLTKAVVDIDCEYIGEFQSIDIVAQGVVQLLRGVNNTKFLSWAKGILYALVFARQIEDFFPTFPFLTRFALEVDDSGWHLLPLIFSRMPNLESLVFEVDEDTDFDCWWAEEPLSLPDCFLPHVKTIEMRGFAGRKNELKLIKFLLKNCEVLNTMIIKFQKKRVQKMVLMEKLYLDVWMLSVEAMLKNMDLISSNIC